MILNDVQASSIVSTLSGNLDVTLSPPALRTLAKISLVITVLESFFSRTIGFLYGFSSSRSEMVPFVDKELVDLSIGLEKAYNGLTFRDEVALAVAMTDEVRLRRGFA